MGLVAGIGAVLRDKRIGGRARREARLVEVGERRERGDRLLPVVDAGPARIAPGVARPGCRRDGAAVVADLEQLIVRLERLPHPLARIAERPFAIGDSAAGGVRKRRPVERDEGAPGEIGDDVALVRRRVVDAVRRDDRRNVGRTGPRRQSRGPCDRTSAATAPARLREPRGARRAGIPDPASRRVRAGRRSTRRRARMSPGRGIPRPWRRSSATRPSDPR